MIENGMLVNQTEYDTQCREPKTVRCACCGENVPEYDAVEILGRTICAFCEDEFCAAQFPELGQAYLLENESEYLLSSCDNDSESLFYNWWLDSLIKTERLRVPTRYRMPARALVQEIAPNKLYEAEIKRRRQKRSLDANAYFWLLCGKLAAVTGISKNEIYRQYIREIGDNFEIIPVRSDAAGQWKKIWDSRGDGWLCISLGTSKLAGYINLCCYYGSSTYDTVQMSRMIDMIVQDCKDQGIETAPPDEIARMKARWADAPDDKGV